jgi:hypothetical protein
MMVVNYAVVCEECRDTVLRAPHIGDLEADVLVAHLKEQHREELESDARRRFAAMLKRFRVKKAD